jgi:hypothetical protein
MLRVILLTVILGCAIFSPTGSFAQQSSPIATVPSYTDPHISSFNNPHFSWLPAAVSCNQLLLFLPGTNGVPRPRFPFLETAAALGYHVIELSIQTM